MLLRSGKRKKSLKATRIGKRNKVNINYSSSSEHQRFIDSCLTFLESSEESLAGFTMDNSDENLGACGGQPHNLRDMPNTQHSEDNQTSGNFLRQSLGLPPIALSTQNNVPSLSTSSIPTTSIAQSSARSTLNLNAPPFTTFYSQNAYNTIPRLPAYNPYSYESENSTDRLLREMISKIDLGFKSLADQLHTNSSSRADLEPSQTLPTVDNSVRNARSVNHNSNSTNIPQSTSSNDENTNMSNISKLENIVASLAASVNSLSNRFDAFSTSGNNSFQNNQSFNNNSSNVSNSNAVYRTMPHKWRVKYTGDNNLLSVEFFIDQLTILKESSQGISWDHVLAVFPQFLEGEAAKWFIRYRKKLLETNEPLNWYTLRKSMISQFRGPETEVTVWCKLMTRKQGERESFKNYYKSIEDLKDRISGSYDDQYMIGILRNNINSELAKSMTTYKASSLSDFVNKCLEMDNVISRCHPFSKRVSEVEVEPWNVEVEAVYHKHSKPNNSKNFQNLKCWNCDKIGHDWKVCDEPLNIFCYWCGFKNVKCKSCPNCNSNNQNFRPLGRNHDPLPQDQQ